MTVIGCSYKQSVAITTVTVPAIKKERSIEMAVKIFTLYGDLPPKDGITFKKPSMTQQHFKEECDINRIMQRYEETGNWGEQTDVRPQFGDFSAEFDFRSAQDMIINAREAFAALPSRVRKRFNNDPAELMAFVMDEANREEAISLGLIEKPEEPVQEPVQPAPAPEGGAPAEGGASGQ